MVWYFLICSLGGIYEYYLKLCNSKLVFFVFGMNCLCFVEIFLFFVCFVFEYENSDVDEG